MPVWLGLLTCIANEPSKAPLERHVYSCQRPSSPKLRRNAISVAANAPWYIPKLRRSGIVCSMIHGMPPSASHMHCNHEPRHFQNQAHGFLSPHRTRRGIKGEVHGKVQPRGLKPPPTSASGYRKFTSRYKIIANRSLGAIRFLRFFYKRFTDS